MTGLIVDDVPSVRMVVANWLEDLGVERCLSASNGEEAWQVLMDAEQSVDFVVLDWTMPEVDGLELLGRLRLWDRHERTPVIMISAERSSELLEQAEVLKATAILSKPFGKSELHQALVSCGILLP